MYKYLPDPFHDHREGEGLAALAVVLTPALIRPGLRPAGAGRRAVNINAAPDAGELPRAA